jgi:hypothetical protein
MELIQPLEVDESILPSLRHTGVDMPLFTTSHTGNVLIVGGRGLLQFYAIHEQGGSNSLALTLIEDVTDVAVIRKSTMVSCLALPHINKKTGRTCDWVVIGDSSGKLYGFKFDDRGTGKSTLCDSGCLRTNKHEEGTAIGGLLASYGAGPEAHYRAVQEQGISYSMFLNIVPQDSRCFYSLGADGKLFVWKRSDKGGWESTEETRIPEIPGFPYEEGAHPYQACKFVAGHPSRLVPHVVIVVEQERRLLMCYDSTRPHELPSHGVCSYAT